MKLGVMLEGQEGLTWDLWRRIMARVEELGFESLVALRPLHVDRRQQP